MWAIILSFLTKYWAKILGVLALVGIGVYGGARATRAWDKSKIDRAEKKAEEATTVAQHANKAVQAEKLKTEQVKESTAIKEQVRNEEQVIEDRHGDSLVDLANSMFDDSETD
jgi:hypothetical protein